MLRNLARGVKDGALAMALKAYVNDKLNAYGEITECTVDTESGRLTAKAMLKGERESVSATIERYEMVKEGEDTYIVLKTFTSSRPWLTLLLNKLFADKRYKLPGAVSRLL
jgi:predicted transcriptional regulator